MVKRRVVVTGLGAVTPIGNNVQDVWESIEGSHSGITKITKFDASNYASQIAGEVKNFNAADHLNVKMFDEQIRLFILVLLLAWKH